MALRNPFSSREKQVSDSNLRDMQRSEAPTGAIGRLSSKVRNMVNAVATRVRWFVSDSWDMAKVAALSAAAAAAPNVANAGENMLPNQHLGNHALKTFSAELDDGSNFDIFGGAIQGDKSDGAIWARLGVLQSNPSWATGMDVTTTPWVWNRLSLVASGRVTYDKRNAERKKKEDEAKEKGYIIDLAKGDPAISSGTTYVLGATFDQPNARYALHDQSVGKGPLEWALVELRTYTNLEAWWSIDFLIWYKKHFDRELAHISQASIQRDVRDLADRIETWDHTTITTTDQNFSGYENRYVQGALTARVDNKNAFSMGFGSYATNLPSSPHIPSSGMNSRAEYIFADGRTNARVWLLHDMDVAGGTTYRLNMVHRIGMSPIALEASFSKTEWRKDLTARLGFLWRLGGKNANGWYENPVAENVAQLTWRTPEGAARGYLQDAANSWVFDYTRGKVHTIVSKTSNSQLVSTEMKNTGAALSLSTSNLSVVAGTPQRFDVVVSDATPLSISQTGNILAREVSKQVLPDGKVRYTIEVSSNSDMVTNDTKVLLSAGTTQESVIVTVTPAPPKNSAPIANSDAEVTDWKKAITLDVLANDTDKEGDALTLAAATVNTDLAQVAIVGNKLLFTPKEGVAGQIIVSYTVRDAHGNESPGVATITVKKPVVIDIGVSAKSISIQQTNTSASKPITLTLPQGITEANIDFSSLPKGVHMVRRQAPQVRSFARSARALPQQAVGFQVRSALSEPQPEPTYDLEYDIVVDSDARVGTHQITAIVKIDNEQQGNPQDLFALTVEAKTPQNSDPVLSAPGVSFTGDQGIILANNLSDADGISNLVYIVVDANGNEIPSSSANFSNLKPGNYTAYTQALAYNPDTNSSKIVQSATVSFSIATPDTLPTVNAPSIQVNGQDIIAGNNILDPDGVVDISYILVGPGGFETPRLDGNFSNLPPGNYTLFTKARVRNATTGEYTDVTSPQSSFVILSPDSKPVLTPPSVLRGRLSASLINNITDSDGISNLVYVVVDANGNENVQPTANFANLRPGSYTAYTQALAFNATTGSSERVTSERTPFIVDAVDTETTFKGAPQYSVDQSARSVRVTDAGAMDSDGIVGYQYYLIASWGRIANIDGNFTNVPPGTYTLEVDASGVDGSTGAVKVATNPNKPTITIEAPKVDAPTIYSDITGVRLSDSSFQITSSGISDADGEIASLLYVATNTRTGQQLSSANGRFDNLDWGDWVVITTGMAKDGATGALKSVRNDLAYRFTQENPDPAPVAPLWSAFANLTDMIATDRWWFSDIGILTWPDAWTTQIHTGWAIDPLGRSIIYSATGLPDGLAIDANTGVISGIYDANGGWWNIENYTVTVSVYVQWSTHILQKSFILGIQNDG